MSAYRRRLAAERERAAAAVVFRDLEREAERDARRRWFWAGVGDAGIRLALFSGWLALVLVVANKLFGLFA